MVSPGLAVQLTTPSCSSSFVQSFTDSGFQVEACTLTVSLVYIQLLQYQVSTYILVYELLQVLILVEADE